MNEYKKTAAARFGLTEATKRVGTWDINDLSYITKGADPTQSQVYVLRGKNRTIKIMEFFNDWYIWDESEHGGRWGPFTEKQIDQLLGELGAPSIKRIERAFYQWGEAVQEQTKGPGKKSGYGVAKDGKINQKPPQRAPTQPAGGAGTGAGMASPPIQPVSGTPNKKEDEFTKDIQNLNKPSVNPKSPLGAAVAQSLDQPTEDPEKEGEKPEEKPITEPKAEAQEPFRGRRRRSAQTPHDAAFVHQVKVARQTLKLSPLMARVMGGPTPEEARAFLAQHGLHEYFISVSRLTLPTTKLIDLARTYGGKVSETMGDYILFDFESESKSDQFKNKLHSLDKGAELGEAYKDDKQVVTTKNGKPIKVPEDKFREAQKTEPTKVIKMPVPFKVQTKEGPADGAAGDYLARGVEGEMWPIDKKIFKKTHKFVGEETYLMPPDFETEVEYDDKGKRHIVKNEARISETRMTPFDDLNIDGKELRLLARNLRQDGHRVDAHGGVLYTDAEELDVDEAMQDLFGRGINESVINEASFEVHAFGKGWSYSSIVSAPNMGAAEKLFRQETRFRRTARQNDQDWREVEVVSGPVTQKAWKAGSPKVSPEPKTTRRRFQKMTHAEGVIREATDLEPIAGTADASVPAVAIAAAAQQEDCPIGKHLARENGLFAARNKKGDLRHFTSEKLAKEYAMTEGKMREGGPGSGRKLGQGAFENPKGDAFFDAIKKGAKKSTAKSMSPQDALAKFNADRLKKKGKTEANQPSLSHGGNTSSPADSGGTFLSKGELSPEEMTAIDSNWKEIMNYAGTAFKSKPYAVALTLIVKFVQRRGVSNKNAPKVADTLAKMSGMDTDPVSMIVPKVIPRITQEPNVKGSGHYFGGHPGPFGPS